MKDVFSKLDWPVVEKDWKEWVLGMKSPESDLLAKLRADRDKARKAKGDKGQPDGGMPGDDGGDPEASDSRPAVDAKAPDSRPAGELPKAAPDGSEPPTSRPAPESRPGPDSRPAPDSRDVPVKVI